MTDAKFTVTPASGHGLTARITDPHYRAFSRGEPTNQFPALVMINVHGAGGNDTAQGRKQHVKYELTKVEPVLDADQAAEIQYMIQALYEGRTSSGEQGALPIAFPGQKEKEKQKALMERIESWSEREGLTGGELEQRWREHYGIGQGEEHSYGDRGVPGDYHKSPAVWLSEFAHTVGVFAADEPDEDELDDDTDDDGADNGPGDDDSGSE